MSFELPLDPPRDEDLVEVDAHELAKTRLCKVAGCEEDARDTTGRFAGLCDDHKRSEIAAARAAGTFATPQARIPNGRLADTARELVRQARRVERAKRRFDGERHELRKVYLRFGVEAGFLGETR